MPPLTIENTTGSPITIATLGGLVIPATSTVDITARVTEEEFTEVYERELQALVLAGDIIVDDGSGPVTPAEQDDVGDMLTAREALSIGGGANLTEDEFTASPSQTIFILSMTYSSGGYSLLTVNGLEADRGISYTISGTTLTWLDTPHTLDGDKLIIKYQFV